MFVSSKESTSNLKQVLFFNYVSCQADDCRVQWPSGSLTLSIQRYSKVKVCQLSAALKKVHQFFFRFLKLAMLKNC